MQASNSKQLKIISHNVEGFSGAKAELLASLQPDILCIQETHRSNENPPYIPGMHLVISAPSRTHGSAIFVKNLATVLKTELIPSGSLELLKVETENTVIISVYKPPSDPFCWPNYLDMSYKTHIVIGDFNSHSSQWGYEDDDNNGEEVIMWALNNNLTLMYESKEPPTFKSARWRKGYNPDLAFITSTKHGLFHRRVLDPIPKSQHRPVEITSQPVIKPIKLCYLPRFNFRKADWPAFTNHLEKAITTIRPSPEAYDDWVGLMWKIAQQHIPRGCKTNYVAGLTDESKEMYEEYTALYNEDPFSEATVQLGEALLNNLADERKKRWKDIITSTNLCKNSKKAWTTIRKLNSEKKPPPREAAVTPNQVAHKLLQNGKPTSKPFRQKKQQKLIIQEAINQNETIPTFIMRELNSVIKDLKTNKAVGIDGIHNEFIKHMGPRARHWLLNLYNQCSMTLKMPKKWKKAKVVALLKPKKDPSRPESYRPISLLCVAYKIYEKLLLNRLAPTVEDQLIKDQAGFREGRSCCGQVLNLTQYIEDGYERGLITGIALVDLSAAYDTVNHRSLLTKLAQMGVNGHMIRILESLLKNRRFFVEMNGRKSRWRLQRNGLPQGSVLSPLLFNLYTNDQPAFDDTRRFLYADDLCLATQSTSFGTIEQRLTVALEEMGRYYEQWSLNANPGKTKVYAFHLKNYAANKKLNIVWNGRVLEHGDNAIYLGVTLDRSLTYRPHIEALRGKLSSRLSLLSKLANTKWGADPKTLRTAALALCFSTAEYCAPVWCRSTHSKKIDPMLNEACRIITGALRPTPTNYLYRLSGITPPAIRRDTINKIEKRKQENDPRHPLYAHIPAPARLKSRKSFLTSISLPINVTPRKFRINQWKEMEQATIQHPTIPKPREKLPKGTTLQRREWCALNRARTGVGKTKTNLVKWGLAENTACECGHQSQNMDHLLTTCTLSPVHITSADLCQVNDRAKAWLSFWRDTI